VIRRRSIVTVTILNPEAWMAALRLANGDSRRLQAYPARVTWWEAPLSERSIDRRADRSGGMFRHQCRGSSRSGGHNA
jgi:hypothetical protein